MSTPTALNNKRKAARKMAEWRRRNGTRGVRVFRLGIKETDPIIFMARSITKQQVLEMYGNVLTPEQIEKFQQHP